MDITLNDKEIKKALVDYVQRQGLDIKKCETSVNISAGRGDKGISATIEISEPVKTEVTEEILSRKAEIDAVDNEEVQADPPEETSNESDNTSIFS